MDGIIRPVAGLLSVIIGMYSLVIFFRLILTWFPGSPRGRFTDFLARITDPYLDWWRRKLNLRAGYMDLSPLAGIVALSVAQTVCSVLSRQGKISLGVIFGVCVSALWSAVSFLLDFCQIILILRFIAYLSSASIYSPFWQVIDKISRSLLYRINRIMFGKRLVSYKVGMLSAIAALAVLWIGGGIGVRILTGLLYALPL